MKKNQQLRKALRRRRKEGNNLWTKSHANVLFLHPGDEEKKKCVNEYISLFHAIEEAKIKEPLAAKLDTEFVPYEIPEFYSLEKDIEILVIMEQKIEILNRFINKKDVDSMAADWKNVGGDISEAIRKFRRVHAGEPG